MERLRSARAAWYRAEFVLRVAAIVVGYGIGRVQLDGPVVIRQSGLGLAELLLCVAAIIVGSGQGRVQLDGSGIRIHPCFQISFLSFTE